MSDSQIDEAIISNVEGHWRKVASVIGRAADALGLDGDDAYKVVAKRIEVLVHDGRLEAQGYVQYWRFSEVRLLDTAVGRETSTVISDDDPVLLQLSKAEMIRSRFPGLDALLTYIPPGQQPSGELEKQLWDCDHSRWIPKDGGHVVKIPYRGESVPSEEFEIEPGGWNHEDCDGCDNKIMAGQECWVTTGEMIHVLCDTCYQTLRES